MYDAATGRLVARYADRPMPDDVRHVVEKARYNVPPSSFLPFLMGHHDGGGEVVVAHWGVPIPKRPGGVFNTRIETAPDSPMWRGLLGHSHGLLVAQGFYEWDHSGPDKAPTTPHFIHRADGQPMLLAALLAKRPVDGKSEWCASIVTCAPNALIGQWHDRMPVILEPDAAATWLHPQSAGREAVLALARPAADGVLAAYAVGDVVNSTQNDGPELLAPRKTPATRQAKLG